MTGEPGGCVQAVVSVDHLGALDRDAGHVDVAVMRAEHVGGDPEQPRAGVRTRRVVARTAREGARERLGREVVGRRAAAGTGRSP